MPTMHMPTMLLWYFSFPKPAEALCSCRDTHEIPPAPCYALVKKIKQKTENKPGTIERKIAQIKHSRDAQTADAAAL